MSLLVVLAGAAGLTLFVLGLPPFVPRGLARRTQPYLSGLRGRPSNLLQPREANPHPRLVGAVEALLARLGLGGDDALRARLSAAGDEKGPAALRAEQLLWGLVAALVVVTSSVAVVAAGVLMDARAVAILGALAFVFGALARDWWLTKQIDDRRALLQQELPTSIDLVTLSIMAGESVPAAFARVARILGTTAIGRELDRVVADVRAGTPIVDALGALRQRVPISGVGRLVDALCTGIDKGAPLADVLRAQAEDGREARRRHLLELGGRREVLMLVPVVFLVMPVVVVFALYPGLVSLELLVP